MQDDVRSEREKRLWVVAAIDVALQDPQRVLGIVLAAPDLAAASSALQAEFGFDSLQAAAVLELQWRRHTADERAEITRLRAELESVDLDE